ncbi:2-amino-4-hydroxy-6-hydroxymethyldihydropteridine diphosphokinase [Enterococcus sp. 8G7_MSG3316]|uniref:2-amino-4-hydroxy-6-hydroxymethyldihydropteridine diphosphokinase n=1 Tax=Candidatus Enterococcus testudinis TaxID=1834191 RepID=A0A242A6Y7_9ENTE|nr:2-amino-4-hydroxy-6-hydroxymethyldihydropteridine diphosphokinase [Enterococcus sp. 8G7_MSG3316]OTN76650.1 2-amino-4-hydroxy-6-hydroxymethyldihydropteridine diphosphokinase [Enterococcus sp. 8G7_MSG3316]
MNQVYLSLGSNLGDPVSHLRKAIELLVSDQHIFVKRISPIYQTSPVGGIDQSDFFNLALRMETIYTSSQLLEKIQLIESQLGRKREVRWGPRTIDIDILYFNEEEIQSPSLEVPHKEIGNRLFVLIPLLDICGINFYQYKYLKSQILKLQFDTQEINRIGSIE